MCVEVGLDLGALVRGEVRADLAPGDARRQQVEPVPRGPDRRARAPGAVPEPVDEARAVRLDRGGELLDAPAFDGPGDRVTADEVTEAQQPGLAEVLVLRGVGVDRLAVQVVVHRRPGREARLQPPAEQHVDRGQVLGRRNGFSAPIGVTAVPSAMREVRCDAAAMTATGTICRAAGVGGGARRCRSRAPRRARSCGGCPRDRLRVLRGRMDPMVRKPSRARGRPSSGMLRSWHGRSPTGPAALPY